MKKRWWVLAIGLVAIVSGASWLGARPLDRQPLEADASVQVASIERSALTPVVAESPGQDADAAPDAGVDTLEDAGLAPDASQPAAPDAGPVVLPRTLRHTTNILLVGTDRRPWSAGGGRADTLIVAALDEASGHVGMFSIPRDYYVDFSANHSNRINAALRWARREGVDGKRVLKRIVRALTGARIAHVVVVDMTVLERAVDAVGGVDVVVPCPLMDNFIDPRTQSGRRPIDVPAGVVRMNGVTAAMYARSRHGRSDWDRARRQQGVLLGLRRRVTSASGVALIPRLLTELGDHVETDLSRAEIASLTARALRVRTQNLHGMVLASRNSQAHRTPEGQSVLVPDPAAIRHQLRTLFEAPAPGVAPRARRCPAADVALDSHGRRRRQRARRAAARAASVATPSAPASTAAPPAVTTPRPTAMAGNEPTEP